MGQNLVLERNVEQIAYQRLAFHDTHHHPQVVQQMLCFTVARQPPEEKVSCLFNRYLMGCHFLGNAKPWEILTAHFHMLSL